jgi:hypothetical protein
MHISDIIILMLGTTLFANAAVKTMFSKNLNFFMFLNYFDVLI